MNWSTLINRETWKNVQWTTKKSTTYIQTAFRAIVGHQYDSVQVYGSSDERVHIIVAQFPQKSHLLHRFPRHVSFLIKLQLLNSDHFVFIGASLGEYLIEASRLVGQSRYDANLKYERNDHVTARQNDRSTFCKTKMLTHFGRRCNIFTTATHEVDQVADVDTPQQPFDFHFDFPFPINGADDDERTQQQHGQNDCSDSVSLRVVFAPFTVKSATGSIRRRFGTQPLDLIFEIYRCFEYLRKSGSTNEKIS